MTILVLTMALLKIAFLTLTGPILDWLSPHHPANGPSRELAASLLDRGSDCARMAAVQNAENLPSHVNLRLAASQQALPLQALRLESWLREFPPAALRRLDCSPVSLSLWLLPIFSASESCSCPVCRRSVRMWMLRQFLLLPRDQRLSVASNRAAVEFPQSSNSEGIPAPHRWPTSRAL